MKLNRIGSHTRPAVLGVEEPETLDVDQHMHPESPTGGRDEQEPHQCCRSPAIDVAFAFDPSRRRLGPGSATKEPEQRMAWHIVCIGSAYDLTTEWWDRKEDSMGLMETLLGGGQQQADYKNFAHRYDQGHPAEGYSDEEALNRHQEVAAEIPHDDYLQAARAAFDRLSPEERAEFSQHLQQQVQKQQIPFPDANRDGVDDRLQDSNSLAQMVTQLQRQQAGMLGMVLGGPMVIGGGRMMMGGLGGGRMMGGGGGMLGNPLAKAALGGIARFAFKRITGH
jgi:hypothetical protein